MVQIIADTYEGQTLVVRHVFYGRTLKEAESVQQAHQKSDRFYKDSLKREIRKGVYQGRYKGIAVQSRVTLHRS